MDKFAKTSKDFTLNATTSMAKYDLKLKGYVGGWDFDTDYVDWFLAKNSGKPVNILINSLGGSAIAAVSVSMAFKNHGDVHIHYEGFNASAATIASMGAKRVTIDPHAMYLVHKCSQSVFKWASLNSDQLDDFIAELDKAKQDLVKIDCNIAGLYASRCKKPKEDLLGLMKKGGWLTAQEALEWGFVDEITGEEAEAKPQALLSDVCAAMKAEGIPALPGTETKQNFFRRMVDAWVSLFETPTNFTNIMNKTFTLICAALGLQSIALADGKATLTEQQVQTIEDLLAEKDKQITDLEATVSSQKEQIENLKQQPGATTSTVVAEHTSTETTPLDDVVNAIKEAHAMFNALP